MKLTLAETSLLKDSITIISDLVTEAQFKVTADAIELIAMDPANVAMVIFKLLGSSFVEYNVKKEQLLGLNLSDMKQVLRRVGANDSLTLELEEGKLKLTIKGKSTRTFHLPLIDIEEKEQKVPDLKFNATVDLKSSTFNEAIEDADIVAESVALIADPKTFTVAATGDLTKVNVEMPSGDDVSVKTSEKQKSKYSIEYLKKMIQGSKLADNVKIQLSSDYPMRMEYLEKNKVQLAFILAPRVEND